jgi:hypothetical protein
MFLLFGGQLPIAQAFFIASLALPTKLLPTNNETKISDLQNHRTERGQPDWHRGLATGIFPSSE